MGSGLVHSAQVLYFSSSYIIARSQASAVDFWRHPSLMTTRNFGLPHKKKGERNKNNRETGDLITRQANYWKKKCIPDSWKWVQETFECVVALYLRVNGGVVVRERERERRSFRFSCQAGKREKRHREKTQSAGHRYDFISALLIKPPLFSFNDLR